MTRSLLQLVVCSDSLSIEAFKILPHHFCRQIVLYSEYFFSAHFDVYRVDKKRFYWAAVVEVDFKGVVGTICFRFPKTKDSHIEWLEFGSPHICSYKSKVIRKEKKEINDIAGRDKSATSTQLEFEPIDAGSFVVGGESTYFSYNLKSYSNLTCFCFLD
jgi:hypothetical protein